MIVKELGEKFVNVCKTTCIVQLGSNCLFGLNLHIFNNQLNFSHGSICNVYAPREQNRSSETSNH